MGGRSALVHDYFQSTTLHGLPDAFNAQGGLLRCVWVVISLGAFGGLGIEVWILLQQYIASPLLTEYNMVSAHELEFPVVQICPAEFISLNKSMVVNNYHPAVIDYVKYLFPNQAERILENRFAWNAGASSRFDAFPAVIMLVTSRTAAETMDYVSRVMLQTNYEVFTDATALLQITEEQIKLNIYYNTLREAWWGVEDKACLKKVVGGEVEYSACQDLSRSRTLALTSTTGASVAAAVGQLIAANVSDPAALASAAIAAAAPGVFPAHATGGAYYKALVVDGLGANLATMQAALEAQAAQLDAQFVQLTQKGAVLYFPLDGVEASLEDAEVRHAELLAQFTIAPDDPIELARSVAKDMEDVMIACSWKGANEGNGDADVNPNAYCQTLAQPRFDQRMGACYTFDVEGFERTQNIEGFGLQVVVDLHRRDSWRSWPAASAGVEVRVMDQYEPIKFSSLAAPVGSMTRINLRGTKMELMEGDAYKVCYRDIDRQVISSVVPYSDTLCRAECFYRLALANCSCIPIMPRDTLKDPYMGVCTKFHELGCLNPLLFGGEWEKMGGLECIKACRPACSYWDYTPIVTYSKFPSIPFQEWYDETVVKSKALAPFDGTDPTTIQDSPDLFNNFAYIDVSFARLQYVRMTQKESITINGFISQIGGNVGLFVGASMISLAQILIYLLMWLFGSDNGGAAKPSQVEMYYPPPAPREAMAAPRPTEPFDAPRPPRPHTPPHFAQQQSVFAQAEGYVH